MQVCHSARACRLSSRAPATEVPGAVPAFQVHAPPFIPLEHLPPPPPVSQPSAFGTPIAFPQVTIPLHAHPVHPAQHAHLPPGPPLIPPPAMMEPPPPPPPPVSASSQAARAPLTDAEVKAAASAALSKFMKEIPDKEPRRSGSRSRRRSKSSSRRSRSKKRSSSHRSRSRSRRRRSRGRKRSKSRRKRSRSREKSLSSPVVPLFLFVGSGSLRNHQHICRTRYKNILKITNRLV